MNTLAYYKNQIHDIKTLKRVWILIQVSPKKGSSEENELDMLMQDASWQNQIILQWLSKSPTAVPIDREMGSLLEDKIGGKAGIRYLRDNTPITENVLNGLGIGRDFTASDVENIIEMSNAENRELLDTIGKKLADTQVMDEHFV